MEVADMRPPRLTLVERRLLPMSPLEELLEELLFTVDERETLPEEERLELLPVLPLD